MQQEQQTTAARLARLGLVALLAAAGLRAAAEEPLVCREASAEAQAGHEAAPFETTAFASTLAAQPRPAAGLRAFVDPRTGSLVVPTPAKARNLELSPALRQAFSTSSEGLTEVTLPGGTVKVHLEGRFMSATFATIGEDATVRVSHGLGATATPPQAAEAETSERSATDESP